MAKILNFPDKNKIIVNKINDLALELKVNLIKIVAIKKEILKLREQLNDETKGTS